MYEKFPAKGREVYFAFIDLKRAYDMVNRRAIWQVASIHGLGGKLLRSL